MKFTLEQIRKAFDVEFPETDREEIGGMLEDAMTLPDAADLMADIVGGTLEDANNNPEIAAAVDGWGKLGKILWVVKQAFIQGTLAGIKTQIEANAKTVLELEKMAAGQTGQRDYKDFTDIYAEIEAVQSTIIMVEEQTDDSNVESVLFGLQRHLEQIKRDLSELELHCTMD